MREIPYIVLLFWLRFMLCASLDTNKPDKILAEKSQGRAGL